MYMQGAAHNLAVRPAGFANWASCLLKHLVSACRRLVLEDGSVLRGLLPGRPTADSLFSNVLMDDTSLLKVMPFAAVVEQHSLWHPAHLLYHCHMLACTLVWLLDRVCVLSIQRSTELMRCWGCRYGTGTPAQASWRP